MAKNYSIDVILPLYNPDKEMLDEMLNSLTLQKNKDFRLIVIDDTPQNDYVTESLERYDLNLEYHHNELALGLTSSLNLGLEKTKADLIARCDSDDIYHQDRFHDQALFFSLYPDIDICGTNVTKINNDGRSLGDRKYPQNDYEIKKKMHVYNTIAHPTVMFRRKILDTVTAYGDVDIEDYDLWFRAKQKGFKFHNLQKNLCRLRVAGKNEYARPRHHRENFQLKLKYFDKEFFFHSIFGIVLFSLALLIPRRVSQFIHNLTNYLR